MGPLFSISYMSSACRPFADAEMAELVARARRRNAAEAVSGVLLYANGSFLQCIEGPLAAVERVYDAILADPRHHSVLQLLHDPIEEREFAAWPMAYVAVGRSSPDLDDALRRKLTAPQGTLSAARHLVASFWNDGAGPR